MLFAVPLIVYATVVIGVSIWTRSGGEDSEFFFAGRRLNAIQAFLSVLASETSVATIVVFPAVGLQSGYALVWLLAGYIVGRTIVAVFYLRKLYESSRLTIYHTMSARHRTLEGAYLLAKYISGGVRFFLGGYALHQLLGGYTILWILVVAVCVALYSLTGGLRAVVLMDQIQGTLIIAIGLFLCFFLYRRLPGDYHWNPAFIDLDYAKANFFPALFLGGAVLSIGTHGADQDMILRVLATKSFRQARRSLILSGFGAAFVIGLYLTVGYMLHLMARSDLNVKSPLADYVMKTDLPLLKGAFLVLLLAAAMSTLDSTIHSTGAVWKSLMNSRLAGRYWSFFSLLIITASAVLFSRLQQRHDDFLALAMGSMNYINGGLIGIFTVFTFAPKRLLPAGIPLALAVGFAVTTTCEWAFSQPVPWTYTVLLASAASLVACLAPSCIARRGRGPQDAR